MAVTAQELESFTQFARSRLETRDSSLSLDELFDLWRTENPSEEAYSENVAAIAEAIQDYEAGDRGQLPGKLSRELLEELGTAE